MKTLTTLITFALLAFGAASVHAHNHGGKDKAYGKKQDIVDTAVAAGQFTTLAAALQAAGLVDTLKGEGPFTVFAPTDAAFAKLPAGTVETLLQPENRAQLIAILTHHVVAGKVKAEQVVGLDTASTVNGSDLAINVSDSTVNIGNAKVIKADVMTSNGVIHIIDTVLIP
jgi:uncharacterized surface protein with fasciclin (FAS1) repeats